MTEAKTDPIGVQALSLGDAAVAARFDQFVSDSGQRNPFATAAFVGAVRESLGIEADVCVATRAGVWQAAQPVFFRSGRAGRRTAVSVPLASYTSVIYGPTLAASSSREIEACGALASAIRARYIDARLQLLPSITDVRPWIWAGWTPVPSYTYIVDLTRELSPSRSVKKHVRKCIEAEARVSLDWDLERAWPAIESTIQRQGVGIGMGRSTFFAYAGMLRDARLCWMATALTATGDASSVRLQLGADGATTAYDWVAGSDTAHLSSGASAWLVTRVVADCQSRGFTKWDMCGAQYESIARFKSEFGGTLVHGFALQAPRSLSAQAVAAIRVPVSRLVRALRRRGMRR